MNSGRWSLRRVLAVGDALLCAANISRPRYQAALMTIDGELMPVDNAIFHYQANAEWFIHDFVLPLRPALVTGSRWVIQDLP